MHRPGWQAAGLAGACALALAAPLSVAAGPGPAEVAAASPAASAPSATTTAGWAPPGFSAFRARWQPSDALLLDRHGRPLASKRFDVQGRRLAWVTLADASPALLPALLAAEDQRFFQHAGVDWVALAGALWQQAGTAGPARGASSITMQVAALLDPALARPGGPRSPAQKWRQIDAAQALERHWTKPQIVEAYLNTVHFRGELQGLDAASRGLFGKAPSGLDQADSALLAALIRAPNAAPARVARRACAILARTRGPAEACDAPGLALTLQQARLAPAAAATLAPHTAQHLLQPADTATPRRSSLDADLQRLAHEALAAQLAHLWSRGVQDAAAVVLHNRTGQVLAHVGSGGLYSRAAQVDAANASRQAGSTLKPLLYALAFDRQRLMPATLLDDSPIALPTDAGLYTPQNYDQRFVGPVSVRRALAGSLNIPAVRTLGLVGVADFHRLLLGLGLATLDANATVYGPSLALGAADVTLLALSNAYRTLANGGLHSPLRWQPDDGAPPVRLLSAQAAWLVGDILADNTARATTFGFDSVLATPAWTAVKTGTSKDMRDNWCIGWSAHYTVGVWVGNAGGAPMRDVAGTSGAAPAWAQIMRGLHDGLTSAPPAPPPGLVRRAVQFDVGLEPGRSDWFTAALAPPAGAPHEVTLSPGGGRPRIIAPVDGMLLAWDPDIPPAMQALVARHAPGADGLRWWLDGQPLVDPGPRAVLPLTPGRHRLQLRGADDGLLDEVRYEVRGGPGSAAPPAAAR
jgi:penicillin-binding protein 1C